MKNLGIGVHSLTLNLLEKLDPDEESKNNSQDEKKSLKALPVSCVEVGQTYVQSVSIAIFLYSRDFGF
jgi:hypothetical protein